MESIQDPGAGVARAISDCTLAASLQVREKAAALATVLRGIDPTIAPDDARHHFAFLGQSLALARPHLFADYAAWCLPMLAHRGVAPEDFGRQLAAMTHAMRDLLSKPNAAVAGRYVHGALEALAQAPHALDTRLGAIPAGARAFLDRLLADDTHGALRWAREALRTGTRIGELYLEVLAPALNEAGLLWQCNRISVAQEHYCAGVTQMVMGEVGAQIRPPRTARTAVVACVAGEQHAIGSRMVADLLDMTGWRTLWLGANAPGGDLLRMVVDSRADLLALSCTHAPCLHETVMLIAALRALPECGHVKVLVGGYAFASCEGLWRDAGADAFAADAREAAQTAHRLVPA